MGKAETLLNLLPKMSLAELREQWFILFQTEAGNNMSAKLLRLAIAFKAQENEFGAVNQCAAIRQMATGAPKRGNNTSNGHAPHLKPGTRVLREYAGQIHEVLAVENGSFVYRGQIFRSLSEVARRIRGARTSGTTFFGLRGKRGPEQAQWLKRP